MTFTLLRNTPQRSNDTTWDAAELVEPRNLFAKRRICWSISGARARDRDVRRARRAYGAAGWLEILLNGAYAIDGMGEHPKPAFEGWSFDEPWSVRS